MSRLISVFFFSPFSDDDSWDLVTCFCMKPFAGRAMIECNKCNTWIHLSCAKIRKSHVPETYVCQSCRDTNETPDTRRSHRSRVGPRKHLLDWPQVKPWTLTLFSPAFPSTCWTDPSSGLAWGRVRQDLSPPPPPSFMVSHELPFSMNTSVDLSQAPLPFENSLGPVLDFLRFVSASLQTLCVRQSLNRCLARADASVVANRYCWHQLSKIWTAVKEETPHNCHPLWCILGSMGEMVCTCFHPPPHPQKKVRQTFCHRGSCVFLNWIWFVYEASINVA